MIDTTSAAHPWVLGTRGSDLARTQAGHVADALTAAGAGRMEMRIVRTEGDVRTGSLASLGGAGVFAGALRAALKDGSVDVVVHSLKDLPTTPEPGLRICAVPPRADVRDALCARDGLTLATLPDGARVGTGSPRRAAQLRAARPDLDVVDIRGNVPTRLARTEDDLDAVVLAAAGLARLGLTDRATEILDPAVMLPAPGQGALAVETRADVPEPLASALAALDDLATLVAVTAERQLLASLEAGCAAPVGALGTVGAGTLTLEAVAAAIDGGRVLRSSRSAAVDLTAGRDEVLAAARTLGHDLGTELIGQGAGELARATP
ncbi:hydroxymethylbilane synthase [Georgenia sp. H159]|uniref:hydroxymethylbilane synthase n=1 Tax=Georgenia sp. H159 TaxID=3076115 RepID=UPI002D794758|nr:hydroxymethylbilane synthase [Georgenia sp. H159]